MANFLSDVTNFLSGGQNEEANKALEQAYQAFSGINTPTTAQLSLPELQKYAVAMGLTPAQMQAFLQRNNAYNQAQFDPRVYQAQIQALQELGQVAGAGAAGTPEERAAQARAEEQARRTFAGNMGAVEQQAEARGVPLGLMQAALAPQIAGQEAETQNQADLQAQSQAYQAALQALSGYGSQAGQIQTEEQQWQQAVANAANQMQQFNAANQQQAGQQNALMQQEANKYNTETAQRVGEQNTGLANQRTAYNVQVPQQVFENQIQKAQGQAGVKGQQAGQYMEQGKQTGQLVGGLIGAGATAMGGPAAGAVAAAPQYGGAYGPPPGVNTGQYSPLRGYAQGGLTPSSAPEPYTDGGAIPGNAPHSGDTTANDLIHIMASPGEAVIPRSVVAQNPGTILGLLSQTEDGPSVSDVKTILKAMQELRGNNESSPFSIHSPSNPGNALTPLLQHDTTAMPNLETHGVEVTRRF